MDDLGKRRPWNGGSLVPQGAGIYAIYLTSKEGLPQVKKGSPQDWPNLLWREDGLLYIGKAEKKQGLLKRLSHHFTGSQTPNGVPDSTKDTFRRSMGAILLDHLKLGVCLRPSASGDDQYSFGKEQMLSNWIQENCDLSLPRLEAGQEIGDVEEALIGYYHPPVNIQNNIRELDDLDELEELKVLKALKALKKARARCRKLASS